MRPLRRLLDGSDVELDDITNAYLDTVSLEDLLTGEKWRNKT